MPPCSFLSSANTVQPHPLLLTSDAKYSLRNSCFVYTRAHIFTHKMITCKQQIAARKYKLILPNSCFRLIKHIILFAVLGHFPVQFDTLLCSQKMPVFVSVLSKTHKSLHRTLLNQTKQEKMRIVFRGNLLLQSLNQYAF